MTTREALEHPWFRCAGASVTLSPAVHASLCSFRVRGTDKGKCMKDGIIF